jgi:hypothetical protein
MDLTGQILMGKAGQSGTAVTIDLAMQPAGMYFVEIQQAGTTWTGKVVKE